MEYKLNFYDELKSTNEEAKILANKNAAEGTVIWTTKQTQGKGRMGNTWLAEKGMNLSLSLVLRPDIEIERVSQITLITGIAVNYMLKEKYNIETKIKWSNDIILNQKKICGILLESSLKDEKVDFVVLGVGINVNNESFQSPLSEKATSLFIETSRKFETSQMAMDFLDSFDMVYTRFLKFGFSDFLDEYNRTCINVSRKVKVVQGSNELIGECLKISEKGDMIIKLDTGELKHINSGEVSIRGLEGYLR